MVTIDWCKKTKNGLLLIEPNSNMSRSYLGMAEDSIKSLTSIESKIWIATISYYIFYYSLYALMLRLGIKCEIHSCSLEFMRVLLKNYYNKEDCLAIKNAFNARINLQYYADRPVDKREIDASRKYCKKFFIKTKDILAMLTEAEVDKIRIEFKTS